MRNTNTRMFYFNHAYPFEFKFGTIGEAENFVHFLENTIEKRGGVKVYEIYNYFDGRKLLSREPDAELFDNATDYGWTELIKDFNFFVVGWDNGVYPVITLRYPEYIPKTNINVGTCCTSIYDEYYQNKEKELSDMKTFFMTDYEVLNDRVVIMRFSDGTYTKAVCTKDDYEAGKFDVDIGLSICLLKKLLGETDGKKKIYEKTLKDFHKVYDKNRKREKEEKEAEIRRKARIARKAQRRAEAAKKEIDDYKADLTDAIMNAIQRTNNGGDDLK